MKIWCISDTHMRHKDLIIPKEIDMVIHGGDSTNYHNHVMNNVEFNDFIDWFYTLPIKHKVLIAGNHDEWSMKSYNIHRIKELGIIYLEHEYCTIDGIRIFGSPYTPTFGNWYHMKDRSKIAKYWDVLDNDIDILVTHGPPKGILDLAYRGKCLEHCGDGSLLKKVLKINPKYHVFGHIHDNDDNLNSGSTIIDDVKTIFMNVSCVTDGEITEGKLSYGQIIDFKK